MNKQIEIGKINHLKVNRVSQPGLYLLDSSGNEILLPNAYVSKSMQIDSFVEVFVYTDSEDRLVATTLRPYLLLHEFSYLKIVDSVKFGVFVDIGLPKHILVPKNKQKGTYNIGSSKVLQLQIDENTKRLIASEKYELSKNINNLKQNDEVEIILYSKTPLGYKVIVDNKYDGMIFHSEIFTKLNIGDNKRAYVKKIRDDGKLDISLQRLGQKTFEDNILDQLRQNNGKLNLTYKSDSIDIQNILGISKKSFKASLTKLINENKIILEENFIKFK